MTCEHLLELEQAIIQAGFKETFRGRVWTRNCREWVYFDCYLPLDTIPQKFSLAPCVQVHQHRGTHDGQEAGFVCQEHHDAIMGHHPQAGISAPQFEPL